MMKMKNVFIISALYSYWCCPELLTAVLKSQVTPQEVKSDNVKKNE